MSNDPLRRKNIISFLSLLLIAFAALAANVAHATPAIMAANGAPACSSCHTQGQFTKAEGRAGLAAYLAAQTPTCTPPQVLQGNVCVTPPPPPPPTCVAPQVLQGNVCVTPPPPTCVAPEILQGNVCVLPPPPTCVAPEVLQGNVCVTPPPPTCVAPQVLQGNVCVTPPPPTCVAPQVLQGNVCVLPPPPTCVAPEILQGNVCVLPPPPTCVAPEVLQGNVCVLPPPPTCVAPEVLQGNVCVLPPPPTCVAPEVLQGNVCVLPPPPTCVAPEVLQGNVCVTPTPTACSQVDDRGDDTHVADEHQHEADDDRDQDRNRENDDDSDDNGKVTVVPTLSAPDNVSVHAGETLTFAVTAFDCASRPLTIEAEHLPAGAVIENTVDPLLRMTKGVITWTPDVGSSAQTLQIELKVVADDGAGKPVESEDRAVTINVLPATPVLPLVQNGPVQSNTVLSAGYRSNSKQLTVAGQLLWSRSSDKRERLDFMKNQRVVVSDSATGIRLGTASIRKNGKWTAAMKVGSAPCSIDVEAGGVMATQSVKGVNCR